MASQGLKRSEPEPPELKPSAAFDAAAKEQALQTQASAWEAPSNSKGLPIASDDDIPCIDLAGLSAGSDGIAAVAKELEKACREVGFNFITNHGVPDEMITRGERAVQAMAGLADEAKAKYTMDSGTHPAGCGYLPMNNFKLPKRKKGNVNEAFVVKRELGPRDISLEKMPWPSELGADWRAEVEAYAEAMEDLSMRMLPAYSLALGEAADYLEPAFKSPLWRFRLSMYPATQYESEQYGIGPHVDTSFFTLLHRAEKEDAPGLVVWSERTKRWVRVPSKPGTLLVNAGEILRQVSNDTFLAARHYVLNESSIPRLSLPFFFNATADFKLQVAAGAGGGPPKYPPTAYLDGQGVVQGE